MNSCSFFIFYLASNKFGRTVKS